MRIAPETGALLLPWLKGPLDPRAYAGERPPRSKQVVADMLSWRVVIMG